MKKILGKMVPVFAAGVLFVSAMLMFGLNANAYIDPSVMTYVIQAVAGVVIAVGAAIGIYYRRAKKKIQEKLNIEETKEQESDDIIVKDESTTKDAE